MKAEKEPLGNRNQPTAREQHATREPQDEPTDREQHTARERQKEPNIR